MTEEGESISLFLSKIGMLKYRDIFLAKGFDLLSDIPYLTSTDLEEELMITSTQDKSHILKCVAQYRQRPDQAVYEWLRSNYLERYHIDFQRSELTDLNKIASLSLPDPNIYDELEIVLPGHKRRLERAVQKLKLEQKKTMIPEVPIAFGSWAKPACLVEAKFDFLCVKAFIFSQQYPENKVCIDFMVDSGSDVSTIQEEFLEGLNLQLLGPVYSCGIHGGNHTNLYKARLKLGDQELDVEVMGSNYNSLGSRVVRHFRHVIDGNHHVWLKGNYKDPVPITQALGTSSFPLPSSSRSLTSGNSPEPEHKSLLKRKLPASPEDAEPSSKVINSNLFSPVASTSSNQSMEMEVSSSPCQMMRTPNEVPNVSVKLSRGICDAGFPGNAPPPRHQSSSSQASSSLDRSVDSSAQGRLSPRTAGSHPYKDTNDDIDHMETPTADSFPPSLDSENYEEPMLIWEERWPGRCMEGQEVRVAQTSDSQEVVHAHTGESWLVEGELFYQGSNSDTLEDVIEVDSIMARDVKLRNNFLQAQGGITVISLTELDEYE